MIFRNLDGLSGDDERKFAALKQEAEAGRA